MQMSANEARASPRATERGLDSLAMNGNIFSHKKNGMKLVTLKL